jgi:hypothetical protein
MSKSPSRILYVDDQEHFRERFVNDHMKRFQVEVEEDISNVLPLLLARKRRELPDLLLLDLYHDIDSKGEGRQERVEEAKAALNELAVVLESVKTKVDRAWAPTGLAALEEIRTYFPPRKLPILIYSQRGLFFLDEEQMKRVEEVEADWMLKGRGDHYEVQRIRRVIRASRWSRPARDITIAVVSIVLSQVIQSLLG